MSGSDNDTPEDDDRTVFTGGALPPPVQRPSEADDDDDRTQFAPFGGGQGVGWPDPNDETQSGYGQSSHGSGNTYSQPPQTQPPQTYPPETYPPESQPPSEEAVTVNTSHSGAPYGGQQDGTYAPSYPPETTEVPYQPEFLRDAEPATAPPPETPAMPAVTQTPANTAGKLPIGTLINNNYRIDEVLKSGGMGEVYRGIEIHTGDPVAIKAILQEKADDEEAGLMFKREARTLRRLTDETIVRYYNYVPDPELRRYFLIMEFIEGVPLKDFVAHYGALPVDQVFTLLNRLAGGLATAHDAEVIHRDLSPDNVMLEGGQVGGARLIDFGIAQSNVVKEATMAGRFAGKFKYVAPEQLGHYGGHISPATDIYGLALLIAAVAIGKPLDMGSSIVEAVQSRQSIPDLSYAPEELRPILSYMLEPDPADRPATMRDVQALVEDPRRIPEKYLGGWVPPAPPPLHDPSSVTMASGGSTQTGTMAPGLQMPGGTMSGQTLNATLAQAGEASVPPAKKGGAGMAVAGVLLLALLGGGGYYGFTQGWFAGATDGGGGSTPRVAQQAGIPAPLEDTREGFLAAFETGPCTYVTRVSQGPNAGVIEGYSATGETFSGLPVAYEERFGARPEVQTRDITRAQCDVLEFAKALQGRGRNGVEMFLTPDEVSSQAPVTAQLTVPSGQQVWLILVSPRGAIFNLTDRLSAPVGNQRNLSFALTLAQGAAAAPQLLLAVESDEPLAHAALAQNRDQASDLLPKILQEIEERNGAASVAVSYLLLTPGD